MVMEQSKKAKRGKATSKAKSWESKNKNKTTWGKADSGLSSDGQLSLEEEVMEIFFNTQEDVEKGIPMFWRKLLGKNGQGLFWNQEN